MDHAEAFIYSADRRKRVVILRKSSGGYTYREEHHYQSEGAEGWSALWSRPSHYDSLETARREVVFAVLWLTSEHGAA